MSAYVPKSKRKAAAITCREKIKSQRSPFLRKTTARLELSLVVKDPRDLNHHEMTVKVDETSGHWTTEEGARKQFKIVSRMVAGLG